MQVFESYFEIVDGGAVILAGHSQGLHPHTHIGEKFNSLGLDAVDAEFHQGHL